MPLRLGADPGELFVHVASLARLKISVKVVRHKVGLWKPVEKGIAFAAAATFLEINGFVLEVDALEGYEFIYGSMERGEFGFRKCWIGFGGMSTR